PDQDLRSAGARSGALPRRLSQAFAARAAKDGERPTLLGPHPDLLGGRARAHLPGRWTSGERRNYDPGFGGRVRHLAEPAVLPAGAAVRGASADPGLAGAVRAHLRVPRSGA